MEATAFKLLSIKISIAKEYFKGSFKNEIMKNKEVIKRDITFKIKGNIYEKNSNIKL